MRGKNIYLCGVEKGKRNQCMSVEHSEEVSCKVLLSLFVFVHPIGRSRPGSRGQLSSGTMAPGVTSVTPAAEQPWEFPRIGSRGIFFPVGIKSGTCSCFRVTRRVSRQHRGNGGHREWWQKLGGVGFFLLDLSEHPTLCLPSRGQWWHLGPDVTSVALREMLFQAPGRLHIQSKPLNTGALLLLLQEYPARNKDIFFCLHGIRAEGNKSTTWDFPSGICGRQQHPVNSWVPHLPFGVPMTRCQQNPPGISALERADPGSPGDIFILAKRQR